MERNYMMIWLTCILVAVGVYKYFKVVAPIDFGREFWERIYNAFGEKYDCTEKFLKQYNIQGIFPGIFVRKRFKDGPNSVYFGLADRKLHNKLGLPLFKYLGSKPIPQRSVMFYGDYKVTATRPGLLLYLIDKLPRDIFGFKKNSYEDHKRYILKKSESDLYEFSNSRDGLKNYRSLKKFRDLAVQYFRLEGFRVYLHETKFYDNDTFVIMKNDRVYVVVCDSNPDENQTTVDRMKPMFKYMKKYPELSFVYVCRNDFSSDVHSFLQRSVEYRDLELMDGAELESKISRLFDQNGNLVEKKFSYSFMVEDFFESVPFDIYYDKYSPEKINLNKEDKTQFADSRS